MSLENVVVSDLLRASLTVQLDMRHSSPLAAYALSSHRHAVSDSAQFALGIASIRQEISRGRQLCASNMLPIVVYSRRILVVPQTISGYPRWRRRL